MHASKKICKYREKIKKIDGHNEEAHISNYMESAVRNDEFTVMFLAPWFINGNEVNEGEGSCSDDERVIHNSLEMYHHTLNKQTKIYSLIHRHMNWVTMRLQPEM